MSNYKTARQFVFLLVFTTFFGFLVLNNSFPVYSNTAEELENEINQKTEELEKNKSVLSEIEKKIKEISGSTYSLSEKVNLLNAEITKLQEQIDIKNADIEEKLRLIQEKEDLLNRKKELFDMVSTELYMQSRHSNAQLLFSFNNIENLLQNLFVKKTAIGMLRNDIEAISGEFTSLSQMKEDLELEKVELDTQKKDLDDSYALVLAEKNKLQGELNAQMAAKSSVTRTINGLSATLSDLQYQLLIARQGGTHVDVNSVPASSSDINGSLAGFNANAPSGSFAVFSIGAYTHRNGMSQWGAKARAEPPYNQNYQQILSAYYPGKSIRTGTVVISGSSEAIMQNIPTTTYGTLNFEDDYLIRLYEVPETWPMEVLKAQAIAARTYAINYTQNGRKAICTSESCQVVGDSPKGARWREAVSSTRGMILTDGGGAPFSTQYAAVHGGWGNQIGWDTTNGTGGYSGWTSNAYESISGVSWFYKTWYRSGYTYGNTVNADSCYRNPWLTQAEMADLVNIYQIWKASGGNDPRVYPIIDACHVNKGQYSHAEARALASKPVTSVSSVVVSSSNGYTGTVIFGTNAGVITMTGNEFKTVYNLRAPGYLRIPQSGFVHINVHKK